MTLKTKQIKVNIEAWNQLKIMISNIINPRIITPKELSDPQTSIYARKILEEFLRIRNSEPNKEEDLREEADIGFAKKY